MLNLRKKTRKAMKYYLLSMAIIISLIFGSIPMTAIAETSYSRSGLGNTDEEISDNSGSSNDIKASWWYAYTDMVADKVNIKMYSAFSGGNIKFAVYTNDVDKPGTCLGSTVECTSLAAGWNSINLTDGVEIKAGEAYWLVEWSSAVYHVCSDSTGGYSKYGSSTYSSSWPSGSSVTWTQNNTRDAINLGGETFTPIAGPTNFYTVTGSAIADQVSGSNTRGEKFTADATFGRIEVLCPSWSNNVGSLTLKLFEWDTDYSTTIAGTPIKQRTFANFNDNEWCELGFVPQPAGTYLWQVSDGVENVGLYRYEGSDHGVAYSNGSPISGDYMSRVSYIVPQGSTSTPVTTGTAIATPTPQAIKIGWAEYDITPTKVVQFADAKGRSTGVHDNIYTTAMAIESQDGNTQAIMVSFDGFETCNDIQKDLRTALSGELSGFSDLDNLFVNATHSHSTPMTFNLPPRIQDYSDASYMCPSDYREEILIPAMKQAVKDAWDNRATASVGFAEGKVDVGYNRLAIYPDGYSVLGGSGSGGQDITELLSGNDQTLNLMYSFDTNGNIKGVAINIACPAQDYESSTQITADFWGSVRTHLKAEYPGIHILAQVSAAGDQCPQDVSLGWDGGDWDRLETHGEAIADEVISKFSTVQSERQLSVALKHQVFDGTLAQNSSYGHNPYTWELHTIRIGNAVFANNPFELFVDYGYEIKARSMAEQTFLVQLSGTASDDFLWNDYYGLRVGGYLPTYRGQATGAYSTSCDSGHVSPVGGAQLVEQTVSQINNMFGYGTTQIVDETNANITYSGLGWTSCREPGNYNMYLKNSNVSGSYIEYTFTGTSIKWFDSLYSDRGKADVYIDNVYQTQIDCYTDWHQPCYQTEVYRKTGLTNGVHTIKIVNTGTKNTSSSDTKIGVDYFVVGTTGSTSTPTAIFASKSLNKTATASTTYPGADASKVVDGIYGVSGPNNFWSSTIDNDVGAWWKVDLGSPTSVQLIYVSYRNFDDDGNDLTEYHMTPETLTIQTSTDNVNWTTQVTKSTNVPTPNTTYYFDMYAYSFNVTTARYVRLVFEDGTSETYSGYKYAQLCEVEVW